MGYNSACQEVLHCSFLEGVELASDNPVNQFPLNPNVYSSVSICIFAFLLQIKKSRVVTP